MHYYQHNIGDYRRDTTHLTLVEHGVYRQMLDWCYLDESGAPSDRSQLYRRLCARSKSEKQAVENVLSDFFILGDDGNFYQARVESEIHAYNAQSELNRENGRKGGRPKKHAECENPEQNQPVSGIEPDQNRNESETKPNQNRNESEKNPNSLTHKLINARLKTKAKKSQIDFSGLPAEISESVASAFVDHRNALKKPLTQHAFDLVMQEAMRSHEVGFSPDQAINTAIMSGWQGLKIDWLNNKPRASPANSIDWNDKTWADNLDEII